MTTAKATLEKIAEPNSKGWTGRQQAVEEASQALYQQIIEIVDGTAEHAHRYKEDVFTELRQKLATYFGQGEV